MRESRIVQKSLQFLGAIFHFPSTLFAGSVAAQAMSPPQLPASSVARMIAPEARLPIRLQKVDVRAEVLGTAAHTRIEMVFHNPNARQLEGELQFPLLDGQTVAGFALDINGELRPADPVDKARDQQVIEDVTRARIDPALLEKAQGNNYKLRVYPLPAHGTRRVVLELDDTLSHSSTGNSKWNLAYHTYRLPLQFAGNVEQLDVAVHNAASPAKNAAAAVRARLGVENIEAAYAYGQGASAGSLVAFSRRNYAGKQILSIDFPRTGVSVATESREC